MIGIGTVTLFEHPDQLAALRADAALSPAAVEEMLRYLSINHSGLPRAATEDVTVGGQQIKAGEGVLVMLNAANRDESSSPTPTCSTSTVPRRTATSPSATASTSASGHPRRVELTDVFAGLFDRLPGLRPLAPIDELPFRHDMVLYGVRGCRSNGDRDRPGALHPPPAPHRPRPTDRTPR